jgi:hypothetical protein
VIVEAQGKLFLIYPAIANRINDFVNKALKTRSADLLECRKLLREHTQVAIAVATKIWPAASVAPEPRGAAPSTPKITMSPTRQRPSLPTGATTRRSGHCSRPATRFARLGIWLAKLLSATQALPWALPAGGASVDRLERGRYSSSVVLGVNRAFLRGKNRVTKPAYRQNVIAVTSSEVRHWQDDSWPGGWGSPISKSALLPRRSCGGAFY